MKLIIDIEDEYYEMVKHDVEAYHNDFRPYRLIAHGKPFPIGVWIAIEINEGEYIFKCSSCGMRVINPYDYCPICGSYNGGQKK